MVEHTARLAFSIALLLALAITPVHSQGNHTLQGRVILPNGAPPPNSVKVTLTYKGRRINETFTDLSGRFSFGGLVKGNYELIADGDGNLFETTNVSTDIFAFGTSPQTFTQNIQLRVKAGKIIPPAATVSADEIDGKVPENARKEFEAGLKRAKGNDPEKAIKHFRQAITVHPGFYSAFVALGDQHSRRQEMNEAVEAYRKAIELRPERADGYIGLGVALVKKKDYEASLSPLRKGVEINNQAADAHLFLGLAEMQLGDLASAERDLLAGYRLGKSTVAHIYLANVYELMGQQAKAIEHLEAFISENPQSPSLTQIREAIEKLKKQRSRKQ